jgi:hypothetical protein
MALGVLMISSFTLIGPTQVLLALLLEWHIARPRRVATVGSHNLVGTGLSPVVVGVLGPGVDCFARGGIVEIDLARDRILALALGLSRLLLVVLP